MKILSPRRLAAGIVLAMGLMAPVLVWGVQAQVSKKTTVSQATASTDAGYRSAPGAPSRFGMNTVSGANHHGLQTRSVNDDDNDTYYSDPVDNDLNSSSANPADYETNSSFSTPGDNETNSRTMSSTGRSDPDAIPATSTRTSGARHRIHAPTRLDGRTKVASPSRSRSSRNGRMIAQNPTDPNNPGNLGDGDRSILPGVPVTFNVPTIQVNGTLTRIRSDAIELDAAGGKAVLPSGLAVLSGGGSYGTPAVGSRVSILVPTFTGALQWLQDGRLTLLTGTGGSVTLPAGLLPQAFLSDNNVLVRSRDGRVASMPLNSAMNLSTGTVLTSLPAGFMATTPSRSPVYGNTVPPGTYSTAPPSGTIYGNPNNNGVPMPSGPTNSTGTPPSP